MTETSKLIEKLTKDLHEVTVDQIKAGDEVAVLLKDGALVSLTPGTDLLRVWREEADGRRFFLAEEPGPVYEPCLVTVDAPDGTRTHYYLESVTETVEYEYGSRTSEFKAPPCIGAWVQLSGRLVREKNA